MGGEGAQYMYTRTVRHAPEVYHLYDTKDMRVRLSRYPDGLAEIPIEPHRAQSVAPSYFPPLLTHLILRKTDLGLPKNCRCSISST